MYKLQEDDNVENASAEIMWQVNGQFGRLFFLGLFESAWKPSESSVLSYYLSVFSSFCVFIFLSFHLSALVFSCPATFFLSSLFRGFYMDGWMEWLSGHRTSETLPKCKGNPFWKVAAQTGIAQKNWDPTPPLSFLDSFFLSDGRYGIRNENIRSAFFQQWVYASNIQFWGLWKGTVTVLLLLAYFWHCQIELRVQTSLASALLEM